MHENLFKGIDLPEDKIHVPYGSTKEDCEGYEKAMENVSVDVQVLGIGGNGHIGFNEPGTPFTEETHIVELTEKTRSDNARFFDNDINQVPTHAITMGIATIMKAKKILLVASGANKQMLLQLWSTDRLIRHVLQAYCRIMKMLSLLLMRQQLLN